MKITLDLNNPSDARKFLLEALPEAFPARPLYAVLKDGSQRAFSDMTDSEVIQYAWELLPIFQAAFPDNVNVQHEH